MSEETEDLKEDTAEDTAVDLEDIDSKQERGSAENLKVLENIVVKQINVDIAYPNPFNSTSNLNFYIHPKFGDLLVEINVLDAKGRLVESIVKKEFNPGFHTQLWNAKGKPSGIYFIQLSTDNYINTQKVLYLK